MTSSLYWRPLSLQPLVLSCVVAFTILTVVTLGILQWMSNRDNGIMFSEKPDGFPAGLTFLYLYFPDILAVSYSTIWNWIDLDVKRLEPWYQLSHPSGASAEDSLLLKYPLEFMTTVPLRSAKRKQWAVFCTSTILVAVFWAVTPLQSGIFAVKQIHRSKSLPVITSNQFLPLGEQTDKLDLNFVNDGYGITWVDQALPPFTTRNYTLAPFRVVDGSSHLGVNKTLTSTTTLFGADLDCVPPAVAKELDYDTFKFADGRGCVLDGAPVFESGTGFSATYNGYYSDKADVDPNLNRTGCNEGTYIATWARKSDDFQGPFTALFCYSSYYEQEVQATVKFPGYTVESVSPIGPRLPLSNQTFAVSHFENIIETQTLPLIHQNITSPQQDVLGRRDIDDKTKIDQSSLLMDKNISGVTSSELVGFAVGLAGVELEGLLEPTNLHHAFRATHQLLFALGAGVALQGSSSTGNPVMGVETSSMEAVLMVEAFSYIVIGFLCLIAIVTAYVLYIYIERPLNIRSGQDSIALNMALAHRQTDLLSLLRPLHSAKMETLERQLQGCFFKLENQADECRLVMTTQNTEEGKESKSVDKIASSIQHWPAELTFAFGGAFIIIIGGAIACLLIFYRLIVDRNGLSLPSNNTIVQQILLILLPTAFGTLLEPFWVALNRLLCVLQPFYELQSGSARASKSILLRYTSLPPQLTLWRALKAKHFLLATMCTTAAISNVLTVSLSALFEMREVDQTYPIQLEQNVLPQAEPKDDQILSGRGGEPLQIMLANLTGSAPLPPWVTQEAYLLPVDIPSLESEPSEVKYNVRTLGIQSQLDCREMETSGSDLLYHFSLNYDATQANFSMHENKPDGGSIRCYARNAYVADNAKIPAEDTQVYLRGSPEGRRGVELFMLPKESFVSSTTEEMLACSRMLIAGWVRSTITLESERSETLYGLSANVSSASIEQTWMMCKPRYESGLFDAVVDRDGRVLDAVRHGPLNQTADENLGEKVWNATMFLIGQPHDALFWHSDTLAMDWANLFIRESGWTSIIDPTAPLPEFTTIATAVNKVYQQLYAITLGTNKGELLNSEKPLLISAKKIVKERRIFFSPPMFWITFGILVFDLLVALAFYLRVPRPFLPRMPINIASLLAYFGGSNIMLDLRKSGTAEEEAISHFKTSEHRYGFGKYTGTDDQVNIGIDRQPYLLPRDDMSLRERIFSKKPIVRSRTVDSDMT